MVCGLRRGTIALCCIAFSSIGTESATPEGPNVLAVMLSTNENRIDIGRACLTIAKDVYPSLRVAEYDGTLDRMAQRVSLLAQGASDPVKRIGLLNTFFFKAGWWNDSVVYTYDLDDLDARRLDNRYLNGILATRNGSCVTMSMLYLVVADRLDWPIAPVRAAKHVFCRYNAPGFDENNIEPTCGGGYLTDSQYVAFGGISLHAIRAGVYMRSLSKREYIATLISNHALQLIEMGRRGDAREYLDLAISLDSTLSSAYWNLGQWYEEESKIQEAGRVGVSSTGVHREGSDGVRMEGYRAMARALKARAHELGIVLRLPDAFVKGQKKAVEKFRRTGEY